MAENPCGSTSNTCPPKAMWNAATACPRCCPGAGAGCTRWFFYPGFTPGTGGLLREADLAARQAAFDRAGWRARHRASARRTSPSRSSATNPPACPPCWSSWRHAATRSCGHARPRDGRSAGAAGQPPQPARALPAALPQPQFDEMLWACDLNCVRGEDSLVRPSGRARPSFWAHLPGRTTTPTTPSCRPSWTGWMPPSRCRRFHAVWNGITPHEPCPRSTRPRCRPGAPAPARRARGCWHKTIS